MIHQTSQYRIVEKVGGGFPGVACKAEDMRLHRFVALKFPPPALSSEPPARWRFQSEPLATSALNQPNTNRPNMNYPNMNPGRGGGAWA
jgi:eukaryotic-like serine/threonine-protein kinase